MTDGRTDGPTDGQTDKPSYRDARTHLKTENKSYKICKAERNKNKTRRTRKDMKKTIFEAEKEGDERLEGSFKDQ